jgi:hypothetical protein
MKIYYRVRAQRFAHPDGGRYTGYGIEAVDRKSGKRLAYQPDVFCDKDQASALADACNKGKLEPVHLFDVIENALAASQDVFD